MQLFENEIINIGAISAVSRYVTDKKDTARDGLFHYNACLSTYELVLYLSGENITRFCGKELRNTPGSLMFLPKGRQDGRYEVAILEEGAVCIDIYFDTAAEMPTEAFVFPDTGYLEEYYRRLLRIWSRKGPGYYAEAMSLLYNIIREFKAHNTGYQAPGAYERLQPAYRYLLENYTDPDFDYRKMCEESGLKYSYFCALFRSVYHKSPVKAVTAMRLRLAKELLITGRYSVSRVAEMCGYENVYYFSNVFKKETGISPGRYAPESGRASRHPG